MKIEELEPRLALSQLTGRAAAVSPTPAAVGAPAPSSIISSPVKLSLVALHELGHALGLQHSSDPNSIMYSYYNPNYNVANFAQDPAVKDLQTLYSGPNSGPWKDSLDPHPGNGKIEVGYSFVPDGTPLDQGTSSLFATFNAIYGSPTAWQPIFVSALNLWASVSNLSFYSHKDAGLPYDYPGRSQNDLNSGDIRIGAEDLNSSTIYAHTYSPPPGGTGAGDSYYNTHVTWDPKEGLTVVTVDSALLIGGTGGGGSSHGAGSGTVITATTRAPAMSRPNPGSAAIIVSTPGHALLVGKGKINRAEAISPLSAANDLLRTGL